MQVAQSELTINQLIEILKLSQANYNDFLKLLVKPGNEVNADSRATQFCAIVYDTISKNYLSDLSLNDPAQQKLRQQIEIDINAFYQETDDCQNHKNAIGNFTAVGRYLELRKGINIVSDFFNNSAEQKKQRLDAAGHKLEKSVSELVEHIEKSKDEIAPLRLLYS